LTLWSDRHWFHWLSYFDRLYTESIEAGVALNGRLWVIDAKDFSPSRLWANLPVNKQMSKRQPGGEHPMPEAARTILVCNAPWFISTVAWPVAQKLIPARTLSKVKLFKAGSPDFQKALFELVDEDQVPPSMGGSSTEPWDLPVGGDVPKRS